MGKFNALAEALGLALEKYGDDAIKILEKVDSPELATSLKGKARSQYLEALDSIYGNQAKRSADMGFGKKTWYHGSAVPIDEFKKESLGLSTNANSAKKGFFFTNEPSTASDYAELAREKGVVRDGDKVTTKWLSDYESPSEIAEGKLNELQKTLRWDKSIEADGSISKYAKKDDLERINGLKKQITELQDSVNSVGQNVTDVRLKGDPLVKNYKGESYRDEKYSDLMDQALKQKKDSVLFQNTYDPADPNNRVKQNIAAVFDPEQIRSTRAAFDPRFKDSSLLMAGALTAPMAEQSIDMNPLNDIKAGFDVYDQGKEKLARALASQINIGKNPQDEAYMTEALKVGADPLNFVPGVGGLGLGLVQAGAQALPKTPQQDALDRLRVGRP